VIQRLIVSLIALPFVLLPIWLGGIWVALLIVTIALAAGWEFYGLMEIGGYRPVYWLGLLWLGLIVLTGWQPQLPLLVPLLSAGLIALLIYALYETEQPASRWMSTSIGALYIGAMMGQALALRLLPNGLWWLLLGVLITWGNDTAAYFVGVTLGRHKLWPRLSPKKSWEGTIGGWLGGALVGGVMAVYTPLHAGWGLGLLLGFVGGVLALFGDLSVSMLKRQMGVKDTGRLFPGHGGMLDRLDSILFVLPFVYQVVVWVIR
jgi:phosphatidate cytidylyltransferase